MFTQYGDIFTVKAEHLTKGSHIKVKVRCDFCNKIIDVVWKDYLRNKGNKYACSSCRQTKTSENSLYDRQFDLYNKALDFCNEKHYVLLCNPTDILNSNTIVKYYCPKHGIQETKIYALILHHGCHFCQYEQNGINNRLDLEDIEKKFFEFGSVWLNKYEYVSSTTKNLIVTCPDCGEQFTTSYFSYFKHNGQRCPKCTHYESNGEYLIRQWLEDNNIKYIPQYRFDDCKYKNTLPFDFYLIDLNILIEYDGEQHYIPIKRSKKMTQKEAEDLLSLNRKRDEIKNNYCKYKQIVLLRIPYWEKNNICNILNDNILA